MLVVKGDSYGKFIKREADVVKKGYKSHAKTKLFKAL